jgi:hypothetical protein
LDDDAFYYIEVGATAHLTNGRVVVQINGPAGTPGVSSATDIDVSGIQTLRAGSTGPYPFYNQFHVGVLFGFLDEARNFSFDDFYVRQFENGFLGDMAVVLVDLEDDRAVDFTRLSGSKNYLMLNETDPDDDTTYNETDGDGDEDVLEIGDADFSGNIHCVQLVARARKTDTEVWTLECLLDLGGTKSYSDPFYMAHPDYETLSPCVFGDAPGDLAWTLARLNAVGVGYRAAKP